MACFSISHSTWYYIKLIDKSRTSYSIIFSNFLYDRLRMRVRNLSWTRTMRKLFAIYSQTSRRWSSRLIVKHNYNYHLLTENVPCRDRKLCGITASGWSLSKTWRDLIIFDALRRHGKCLQRLICRSTHCITDARFTTYEIQNIMGRLCE